MNKKSLDDEKEPDVVIEFPSMTTIQKKSGNSVGWVQRRVIKKLIINDLDKELKKAETNNVCSRIKLIKYYFHKKQVKPLVYWVDKSFRENLYLSNGIEYFYDDPADYLFFRVKVKPTDEEYNLVPVNPVYAYAINKFLDNAVIPRDYIAKKIKKTLSKEQLKEAEELFTRLKNKTEENCNE